MARPFDSTDAKRIIERHRKLLAELMLAEESIDGLRTAITKTSDALVAQEVLNVLKGRNCVTDVKSSDNIGEGIITVGMYRLKA